MKMMMMMMMMMMIMLIMMMIMIVTDDGDDECNDAGTDETNNINMKHHVPRLQNRRQC